MTNMIGATCRGAIGRLSMLTMANLQRHIVTDITADLSVAGRRTLARTSKTAFRGTALLGLGLCALPVKAAKVQDPKGLPEVNPSTLTSSSLIKNAAAMAVDSTSTLLTQTFLAVVEKYKELAQDIEKLMDLTQKHNQAEKLGYMADHLWQDVIKARVEVDDRRHELQNLEAILNSALLTLEAASEAAFQAGNEELAMMGRDRCQYANDQLAVTRAIIRQAEEALAKVQAVAILETKVGEEEAK